jgi:hypothetical protein
VSKPEVHSGDNTRGAVGAAKDRVGTELFSDKFLRKPCQAVSQVELSVRSQLGQIRPVLFWFLGYPLKTLRAKKAAMADDMEILTSHFKRFVRFPKLFQGFLGSPIINNNASTRGT